jgi:hypothetical protein
VIRWTSPVSRKRITYQTEHVETTKLERVIVYSMFSHTEGRAQSGDVQQELFLHCFVLECGTENLSRNFGNKLPIADNNNPKQRRIKFPETLRLIYKTEQSKSFSGVVNQTFFFRRHVVHGKHERRTDKSLVITKISVCRKMLIAVSLTRWYNKKAPGFKP